MLLISLLSFPVVMNYISPYVIIDGAMNGVVNGNFTTLVWRNGYWSTQGRVHYTLVTLAALALVWWLNYWNLLGFRS